jgi:hypothetical protein
VAAIEEALLDVVPRGRITDEQVLETVASAMGDNAYASAEDQGGLTSGQGDRPGLGVIPEGQGVSDLDVVVATGGEEYRVGDRFQIGADSAGWTEPATLEVTSVGDDGALANLNVVDGGAYIGDGDPEGDFELTPIDELTTIELQSGSEHAAPATADAHRLNAGVGGIAGAGLLVLIVGAIVIARRRAIAKQSDLPATFERGVVSSSHSLTPAIATNSL